MIEAAPDMKRESEKEWYFGNADKERSGPYGFHEVCVSEELFMEVLDFLMSSCLAHIEMCSTLKICDLIYYHQFQ